MKMTWLVVLTTCVGFASVLRAQNSDTNTVASTRPIAYQELVWTNGVFVPQSGIVDLMRDYQVIVLLPGEHTPSYTNRVPGTTQATVTNRSIIHDLTAYEMLGWQHSAISTNMTKKARTPSEKKPAQILVVEPFEISKDKAPEALRLREYSFGATEFQPAWYEWFNPKLFLNQWAEFWTTETNATPVVLVLIPF